MFQWDFRRNELNDFQLTGLGVFFMNNVIRKLNVKICPKLNFHMFGTINNVISVSSTRKQIRTSEFR